MKKVLTLTAMAFFAVASLQAATVTWQATGQKNSKDVALDGAIAYLFNTADVVATDVVSALKNGTFLADGGVASKAIASKTSTATGGFAQAGIGSYENETVELFMVMFESGNVEDSANVKISDTYSQNFAKSNKTFNFNTRLESASWDSNPMYADVPEPTSLALIALGVAAFGLKRKHA